MARRARVTGIRQIERRKPICKDCGHGHHLVWMHDQWLCPIHLKIRKKAQEVDLSALPASSRDAIEAENTEAFHNLFPNRAARRYAEKEAKRERRR